MLEGLEEGERGVGVAGKVEKLVEAVGNANSLN